jgi:CrcB protein
MPPVLLVFLGGGLGSVCRWGLALLLQPYQDRFPWATLLANGLACTVLGAVLGAQIAGGISSEKRLLLAVGFCGGFSTFSTFTSETWVLWQGGQHLMAALNVLVSMAICLVCLLLGLKLTT